MRVGFNPYKDKENPESNFYHQVIIPVYIPHQEGYFKDSLQILKICLESLFKTSHTKTFFTIVNNGSCDIVIDYLNDLFNQNQIHEIIHTTAIGKINAILKGIVGNSFRLITISDADVLFINNWQTETYEVFNAFPKAGIVGTTPNSKLLKNCTGPVIFDNFFSNNLKFTQVKDPDAMREFAISTQNLSFYKPINYQKYLTITNKKCTAIVGTGHFVATYKSEIFDKLKHTKTKFKLGGWSENEILDNPSLKKGFWRLNTENNLTFHLGNIFENWMQEKSNLLQKNENKEILNEFVSLKIPKFWLLFKNNFFMKIIFKKSIWKLFIQMKGLTKSESILY